MKWLLIGTGGITSVFIKGLRANNETPYAILSRSKEKAKGFAKREGLKMYFDDIDKALKVVEAVYVATPNAYHYEPALKALENKKHVIVEKIMTDSLEKTRNLFKVAKKNNVKLMEAYAPVSSPLYRNIKVSKGDHIKADFARVSSAIRNNTYKTASSFSKTAFGGAMPDIGVYPLSFIIDKLGKALEVKLTDKKYMNSVLAEGKLELKLERGTASAHISKIEGAGTDIVVNGREIGLSTEGKELENRFNDLVYNFINNKYFKELENVSIGVAEVIESIKKDLFK